MKAKVLIMRHYPTRKARNSKLTVVLLLESLEFRSLLVGQLPYADVTEASLNPASQWLFRFSDARFVFVFMRTGPGLECKANLFFDKLAFHLKLICLMRDVALKIITETVFKIN